MDFPRTPETLKLRGLGRPWETGMERLSWQCGPTDAAELEEARRLCFFVGDYLGGGLKDLACGCLITGFVRHDKVLGGRPAKS